MTDTLTAPPEQNILITLKRHTQHIDTLLQNIWSEYGLAAQPITLIATGGYGRYELFPYTDLDLLILYDEAATDCLDRIEEMLSALWDQGLKISQSVRTPQNAILFAEADVDFYTSLLEARCLAGPPQLLTAVLTTLTEKNAWPFAEFFAAKKRRLQERQQRACPHTPHLKNDPGGLRDVHLLRWLCYRLFDTCDLTILIDQGWISLEEHQQLISAYQKLCTLRAALHTYRNRKDDRLPLQIHTLPGPLAKQLQTIEHPRSQIARLRAKILHPIDSWQPKPITLIETPQGLGLRDENNPDFSPILIDFLSGKSAHRRRFGGGKGQALARALGFKHHQPKQILDLSAGFGEDAFTIACLGCNVLMLERSPLIAQLLKDALARLHVVEPNFPLRLLHIEAMIYLTETAPTHRPDVIYFDPMFPTRKKSALNNKRMRILHTLVGEDPDASKVLPQALTVALKRVVVKRPRLADPLEGPQPDFAITGKSSRFDIYTLKSAP